MDDTTPSDRALRVRQPNEPSGVSTQDRSPATVAHGDPRSNVRGALRRDRQRAFWAVVIAALAAIALLFGTLGGRTLSLTGYWVPKRPPVVLYAPQNAWLETAFVEVGQRVAAGDRLMTLMLEPDVAYASATRRSLIAHQQQLLKQEDQRLREQGNRIAEQLRLTRSRTRALRELDLQRVALLRARHEQRSAGDRRLLALPESALSASERASAEARLLGDELAILEAERAIVSFDGAEARRRLEWLENQRSANDAARSRLALRLAELEHTGVVQRRTRFELRSPVAGRVHEFAPEPDGYLQEGAPLLVLLPEDSEGRVRLSVPAARAVRLSVGDAASIRSLAKGDRWRHRWCDGRVSHVRSALSRPSYEREITIAVNDMACFLGSDSPETGYGEPVQVRVQRAAGRGSDR
ncbi:MAG: HlyD family efflux transporter periplasmic adaptor subunit [Pseudomonadota bacterium]